MILIQAVKTSSLKDLYKTSSFTIAGYTTQRIEAQDPVNPKLPSAWAAPR
jgi:hypothetical protein